MPQSARALERRITIGCDVEGAVAGGLEGRRIGDERAHPLDVDLSRSGQDAEHHAGRPVRAGQGDVAAHGREVERPVGKRACPRANHADDRQPGPCPRFLEGAQRRRQTAELNRRAELNPVGPARFGFLAVEHGAADGLEQNPHARA